MAIFLFIFLIITIQKLPTSIQENISIVSFAVSCRQFSYQSIISATACSSIAKIALSRASEALIALITSSHPSFLMARKKALLTSSFEIKTFFVLLL
ncbi:MAG: hypothetical protein HFI84_12735 [Eubacterium sp.]|nr:hypothetical protein [Eubacterium sp.]